MSSAADRDRAVEIFCELGWAKAHDGNASTLPIGTPEQQRKAVRGLATGEWNVPHQYGPNRFGLRSLVDVDQAMLAVFAIRVGVDVKRAAALARDHNHLAEESLLKSIPQRGHEFMVEFVDVVSSRADRNSVFEIAPAGSLVLRLVHEQELELPDRPAYFHNWAVAAYENVVGLREFQTSRRKDIAASVTQDRFSEHVWRAAEHAVPSLSLLGDLVERATEVGLLFREDAVNAAMTGLEHAVRPGDRKTWTALLDGPLAITDEELAKRADQMSHIVASGEAPVVEKLGVRLMSVVDDGTLLDSALPCLYVTTKKAKKAVLKALATRDTPPQIVVDELSARLVELASDPDETIARAALRVLQAWGAEPECDAAEHRTAAADSALWQPTPPVWDVPRFQRGPATRESLAELLAAVLRLDKERGGGDVDVESEQLLAVAVELARHDRDACRAVLRSGGSRLSKWSVISSVESDSEPHEADVRGPQDTPWVLHQRAVMTTELLGTLPCLLSEPTFVDLTISVDDLVARLELYAELGVQAQAADLMLALTRLRLDGTEPVPVPTQPVRVRRECGQLVPESAHEILNGYLADPFVEPHPWTLSESLWDDPQDDVALPESLRTLGFNYEAGYAMGWGPSSNPVNRSERYAVMPNGGDCTLLCLRWWNNAPDRSMAPTARQVARRARPLPPGGAVNLLAVQRKPDVTHAEDLAAAVDEAWSRGLLRPGVADYGLLDWEAEPSHIASFVAALVDVAQRGMLSVVWPILDDIIGESLACARLRPGTVDAADAMRGLAGHVVAAVAAGLAPTTAVDVPHLRSLAIRKGSSRAIRAARDAVELLDHAECDVDAAHPQASTSRAVSPASSRTVTPPLVRAVEVFRALGWADARCEDAPTLPLGTAEQQRTARKGLASGDVAECDNTPGHTRSPQDSCDVQLPMVALFAVRVGVDAPRAAELLTRCGPSPISVQVECIGQRGPGFASGVVNALTCGIHRPHDDLTTMSAALAVSLVASLQLNLPPHADYFRDWTTLAHEHLVNSDVRVNPAPQMLPLGTIHDRFVEHVDSAAGRAATATSVLAELVQRGVEAGVMERNDAVRVALTGITTTASPEDRTSWADLLTGPLALSDDEFRTHADRLGRIVALGDASLVERLGLPLLASVDDDSREELTLSCLAVNNEEVLCAVLRTLGARHDASTARTQAVTQRMRELAHHDDQSIAIAAQGLLREGTQGTANRLAPPSAPTSGNVWQQAPALWQVPPFKRLPATCAALSDALTECYQLTPDRQAGHIDVASERLLAVAVDLAWDDRDGCLNVLRRHEESHPSARDPWQVGPIASMESLDRGFLQECSANVLGQRVEVTTRMLGALPCLLSEPSFDDLSITFGDLATRMDRYAAEGVDAQAADVFLALTRLRRDTVPSDRPSIAPVPVKLATGEDVGHSTEDLLTSYLADPWQEPSGWTVPDDSFWDPPTDVPLPLSLRPLNFHYEEHDGYVCAEVFPLSPSDRYAVLPNGGDCTLTALKWWHGAEQPELAIAAAQIARRAAPLTPGGVINMLSALRATEGPTCRLLAQSVQDAWSRGLLRPGVADYGSLNWEDEPTDVALFVEALVGVSQRGMLALAWPIFDDIIAESVARKKLRPGTIEAAEAMRDLSGHVVEAVAAGLAPTTAVDVPHLRSLAGRKGSSRAIRAACEAVEHLTSP